MYVISDLFFNEDAVSEYCRNQSLKINPFIITFLENIVYKVIQEKVRKNSNELFAVHYFFTKLYEEIFILEQENFQHLSDFLQYLVLSFQLPIETIANRSKIKKR